MVRIPKPSDLNQARLSEHIRHPAQLSSGALSALAASHRAIGDAIASIGGAFGEIARRQQVADDALNNARFELALQRSDREVTEGLFANAGERGEGLERYPTLMSERATQLAKQYPLSDPSKQELRTLRTQQHLEGRSIEIAKRQRDLLSTYYDKEEDQLLQGALEDVAGDPSQPNVDQKLASLEEYARGRQGISRDGPSTEMRIRQTKALVTRAQLEALDPATRLEVLEKIRQGEFVLDQEAPRVVKPLEAGEIKDFSGKPGRQGRALVNPQYVVAHDVSGDPRTRRLPSPGNIGAYHYTFDEDGIYKERDPRYQAPHAVRFNSNSIAIAFRGFEGDKLSPKALENAARLIKKISAEHGIPLESFRTHPDLGKAGTRSSKDPREAAWLNEAVRIARSLPDAPDSRPMRIARQEGMSDALPLEARSIVADHPGSAAALAQAPEEQMRQVQALAERIQARAEESPDAELTDEDREQISQLLPEAAGAGTVGDVLQILRERQLELAEGMSPQEIADGRATQRARGKKGEWPIGKLAPGQIFEVDTQRYGRLRISGDAFSDIGQLKTMHRDARERVQLTEARARRDARSLINRQLQSLETTGRDVEGFDLNQLRRTFGRTREGANMIANYERNAAITLRKRDYLRHFDETPSNVLLGRIENERPPANASDIEREAFRQARARAIEISQQRIEDPALAVESHPAVQAVRRADPNTPGFARALADARMSAQADLDIPEQDRTPLPRNVGITEITRIANAPDGQILQMVTETTRRWENEIGPDNARRAMEHAVSSYVRSDDARRTINRALRDYFQRGELSQQTIRQMLSETGRSDAVDAPPPPTNEQFFEDPVTMDMIRAQIRTRTGGERLPSDRMIRRLIYNRHDPQAHDDFDEIFGRGSARLVLQHYGVWSSRN